MDNVNQNNECYIRHINLHLISDYHAFKSLSTLFDTWNIPNFDVYFYQLELYLVCTGFLIHMYIYRYMICSKLFTLLMTDK